MANEQKDSWLTRQLLRPLWLIAFIAACVAVAALCARDCVNSGEKFVELTIDENKSIDITPQQIRSIERIGQWEFLSIADEELVDTTRRRLLGSNDQLARIYRGTLRLGIDLSKCSEGWLVASGDSVSLTVPGVQLLSEHFIDEARVVAFYESGSWSARDKDALYHRAARIMKARSLTSENYARAEANATEQLTALMRSFGFRTVVVKFGE